MKCFVCHVDPAIPPAPLRKDQMCTGRAAREAPVAIDSTRDVATRDQYTPELIMCLQELIAGQRRVSPMLR
jgi:hypothetical protein